ncbi:MAG: response regulator transcription factor [Limisphaerales bacterium]
MAPPRRRILVVDDHPLMREGIAKWIERAPDLEVCGEAGTAAAAVTLAGKLKPDLLLMDLSMPGRAGLDLIRDLRALHPDLPVLVLSMHDETLYASRALRAGARGYLMKGAGGGHVVKSIRNVLNGNIAVSRKMVSHLLEDLSARPGRASHLKWPRLSDREFEVIQLLGEARSTKEIAQQLRLSPKTIESHRLRLMRKLKLKTGAELLRYAVLARNAQPFVRPVA